VYSHNSLYYITSKIIFFYDQHAMKSKKTCSLPMPGGITGLPCSGGNKYRNLALQVGGVSKLETIK
jgi:hypothetical protein